MRAKGRKKSKRNPSTSFIEAKKEIDSFVSKYPNVEVAGYAPTEEEGQYNVILRPSLATLGKNDQPAMNSIPPEYRAKMKLRGSVIYRDILTRSDLDLVKPDVVNSPPHKLYNRSKGYYRSKAVLGAYTDRLADLSLSEFENDCEDVNIKEFYDNWCEDTKIDEVLEWCVLEFLRSGFVRTYRILGRYVPDINTLPKVKKPPKPKPPPRSKGESKFEYDLHKSKWEVGAVVPWRWQEGEHYYEYAARKKRWSRGFIPVSYTLLDPASIEIVGSPLFRQTRVNLEPDDNLVELVMKQEKKSALTPREKELIDNIPPEVVRAIKNKEQIELDPELVGEMNYRKLPYEKYPIPMMSRTMEDAELKEGFKEADWSTIDGITSEILVITIGDKDYPVKNEQELQDVADLFDTVEKAYSVVWNHTLKVQRVAVENIDEVFGAKKYQQVEMDISGSLGIPRALVDGIVIGDANTEAIKLAIKGVISFLRYVRRQLTRWMYNEYKTIAISMGFERYPKIRWNDMLLKDEAVMKTLVQGLVDRRIISYHTAQKVLGYDPYFEKEQMSNEVQDVVDGIYGILGSPYQQAKLGVQPTQNAPTGTPSEGRPKNQPTRTPSAPTPDGKIMQLIKPTDTEKQAAVQKAMMSVLKDLTIEEIQEFQQMASFVVDKKLSELASLLQESDDPDREKS